MADKSEEEQDTAAPPPSYYLVFLGIMSKRRTWPSPSSYGWPALYASVLLGAVFGLLSMFAALAVMVPATLVTWIAIVVLLAFFGKPRTSLVVEGRKITREIVGIVFKILLKEGNLVAAVCAVVGYFALFRRNGNATPDLID
ncbi:uncharacterized protein LOC133736257 isoform X2 [Rosa rugosa]|uniref:uncharacterized protein LOC133736257 isoform X2 n=1 Tax=Rosa rugosa TaxID=74645 RepID=UPI002B40C6B6|nr:uncharacterized protein LOC133736257 isoform X2 [Rosa rugosa]